MEITTPKEMGAVVTPLEVAIEKFEIKFKQEQKGLNSYHLIIFGEYDRPICDKIEATYKKAGWARAICITSSENGERAGLTSLKLYRHKI